MHDDKHEALGQGNDHRDVEEYGFGEEDSPEEYEEYLEIEAELRGER